MKIRIARKWQKVGTGCKHAVWGYIGIRCHIKGSLSGCADCENCRLFRPMMTANEDRKLMREIREIWNRKRWGR